MNISWFQALSSLEYNICVRSLSTGMLTHWLASPVFSIVKRSGLPIVILGVGSDVIYGCISGSAIVPQQKKADTLNTQLLE